MQEFLASEQNGTLTFVVLMQFWKHWTFRRTSELSQMCGAQEDLEEQEHFASADKRGFAQELGLSSCSIQNEMQTQMELYSKSIDMPL